MENRKSEELSRRKFLKKMGTGAVLTAGLGQLTAGCQNNRSLRTVPAAQFTSPGMETVRIGFVGVGKRGTALCEILFDIAGAQISAVGDIIPERAENIRKLAREKGKPEPLLFTRGESDYQRMCREQELDLIINATPWEWHTPISVEAMRNGKHAATELPAAVTLEECWQLVETAERYQKHCVMLENCCYFRNVMLILNMVRQGIFGELLHCEAGYQHDVRYVKFDQDGLAWRGKHSIHRNGDLYPTHPIGPVAQWMNINRGDAFDYLTSMSSNSRGMNVYAAKKFGPDSELAKMKYALGDIITTLIKTKNGLTITLYHDTQLPRPYDLIYRVQGTNGIYMGTLDKIYIEGTSPEHHKWEAMDKYYRQYEHPLWQRAGDIAKHHGHGGGDYMTMLRLIESLRKGEPMDQDVYDAASWSVISALSEKSIANKSRPVDFPDFTRGGWKRAKPVV